MRHSKLLLAATTALLLSGLACQAEDKVTTPGKDMPAMHDMMPGHGAGPGHRSPDHDGKAHRCMHKGGMMGDGHMPHMIPLPTLPPGNDKLELQMQAEIMQKVGEILAKYAGQVKETPPAP